MKPVDDFMVMLDERTLAEVSKAESDSRLWARVAIASAAAMMAILFTGLLFLRRKTQTVLKDVGRVAIGIADGRLDQSIDRELPGEEGQLLRSMDKMQEQLSTVVGSIRQGADSVVTASSQIAQGNQDLSHRTEQQASALQETAATMEELKGTVRHNADNARPTSWQKGRQILPLKVAKLWAKSSTRCVTSAPAVARLATSLGSSTELPFRRTSSRSTPRSRQPGPVSKGGDLQSWLVRCAPWLNAVPMPPRKSRHSSDEASNRWNKALHWSIELVKPWKKSSDRFSA